MTEEPIKKRIRNAKRKIITTLTLSGYEVYEIETGPFHLCADSETDSKRIRIVFGASTESDVRPMARAKMPANCYREIWQVSGDGKTIVTAKVAACKKK